MKTRFVFPLLVLLTAGLSAKAQNLSPTELPWLSDTRITLEEMGCLIIISADGTVSVEGESGFELDIARIKEKLSRAELGQLISEFLRIDYLSLNDRYRDKEDGCPVTGSDCSSVGIVTSFRLGGKSKRIFHHTSACLERDGLSYPRELTNLERQIKDVVEMKRR